MRPAHKIELRASAANLMQVNDPSVPDHSSRAAESATPVADATQELPAPTESGETIADGHERAASQTENTAVIDLDAIERDLTDVQTALERLNDGSYWTDEVTGEPIAEDVLAAHPTARTATPTLG
jgi:RNA polymerase-binding transcription factor DksA